MWCSILNEVEFFVIVRLRNSGLLGIFKRTVLSVFMYALYSQPLGKQYALNDAVFQTFGMNFTRRQDPENRLKYTSMNCYNLRRLLVTTTSAHCWRKGRIANISFM